MAKVSKFEKKKSKDRDEEIKELENNIVASVTPTTHGYWVFVELGFYLKEKH